MAISFLDAEQVIAGSNSSSIGIGYSYLFSQAFFSTLPLDLVQQNTAVNSNARFAGKIVHNVTSATSATFNGPANKTSTAPTLATLTLGTNTAAVTTQPNITSDFFAPESGDAYYYIASTNGDIRGQLYPLVARTRRMVPIDVDTVLGATGLPSSFNTLRYANQEGTNNNPNSYISATSTQATVGTGNFSYEAVFKFPATTTRRNFGTVRGLILELNLRASGGPWLIEWFNAFAGQFLTASTVSTTTGWYAGTVINFDPAIGEYTNNRGITAVRISTSGTAAAGLDIDLMGLRSYQPTGISNSVLKTVMKQLVLYPVTYNN